jgi:anionic cell wall polymer biosynthesis LytR-Cps2A-Psr (LCP) family protein
MRPLRPSALAGLVVATVLTVSPTVAGDGPSSMGAAGPVPPGDVGATSMASTPLDALGRLGRSIVADVAQAAGDAIAAAASNPCSGTSSKLKRTSNGSLTVLMLGSDYRRRPYIGERTDTVIVMNLARDGRVSMAAIPRDTVEVPLASGGDSGLHRINSLYEGYKRRSVGAAGVDCAALDHVRRDVARALGTEIPYYALIRMDQFQQLVGKIGGIRMNIRYTLRDEHERKRIRKIYVPRSTGYHMNAGGDCGPKPVKCRNLLRYARSRYGTEGNAANTDFRRLRRQQEIVYWTARTVLARGDGAKLMRLLTVSKSRIYTNLPKTTNGALALYAAARNARFAETDGKVFAPSRWATMVGTYTFKLRLGEVRQWVDNHFKP